MAKDIFIRLAKQYRKVQITSMVLLPRLLPVAYVVSLLDVQITMVPELDCL